MCFSSLARPPTSCRTSTSLSMRAGTRGFTLVRDYSCFAYEIAQNSSQHTRALFFDRDIKRVTELAWDQAVKDTANLWQSIRWNTFGPVRGAQMYGIPVPVTNVGSGSLC